MRFLWDVVSVVNLVSLLVWPLVLRRARDERVEKARALRGIAAALESTEGMYLDRVFQDILGVPTQAVFKAGSRSRNPYVSGMGVPL